MNRVKKHILLISLLLIFTTYCYIFGCPFRNIVGIPCPTCGVTHALVALVHLDFRAYIQYNFMAVPLAIAVLIAFHLNLFKHKKILTTIVLSIAIINFFIYLKRLF